MMHTKDREALEALIDQWVKAEGFAQKPEIDVKIAVLSFALEQLKHERRAPEGLVEFEEFTQCQVFPDTTKLVVSAPKSIKQVGTGKAAIQLEAPLLLFLLLHHRERFPVYDIIRLFIEKIRDELDYVDFKKTRTGVTRCFTNTRFAAKVLRAYGLLKFTEREAYKTWELSLTGFLVAADIFQTRCASKTPWGVPSHKKEFNYDLLLEIRQAWDAIQCYDQFVQRLASLCKPDAEVFTAFKPALQKAYALLSGYWTTLSNPNLSQVKRQKASMEYVKQLEEEGITDEFYYEFAQCLQINELLAKIPLPQEDASD
jgi:hypothetical protein